MSDDSQFARLVSLACHDLRTPLATAYGFARTLTRTELGDPASRYVGMIEAACTQMTELLDDVAVAARIQGERYDPALRTVDSLELAHVAEEAPAEVAVSGAGAQTTVDLDPTRRAIRSIATCLARHGGVGALTVDVAGLDVTLSPVTPQAAPIVMGDELRDLGAAVARRVIEAQGGSVAVDGETLRVRLPEERDVH